MGKPCSSLERPGSSAMRMAWQKLLMSSMDVMLGAYVVALVRMLLNAHPSLNPGLTGVDALGLSIIIKHDVGALVSLSRFKQLV